MTDPKLIHAQTLVHDLFNFVSSDYLTDVRILARGRGKKLTTVKAHKIVLGSVSSMIKDFCMENDSDDQVTIMMPDFNADDVSMAMSLAYTGSVDICDRIELDTMLNVLLMLDMSELGDQEITCVPAFEEKYSQTKSSNKFVKCPYCPRLIRSSEIAHHARKVHRRVKLHKCDFCGKLCHRLSELTSHRRTHTGERPFQCSICGKKFTFHHIMRRHEQFHKGDRPYKCKQCKFSFTQRIDLDRHERLHSGEKPYSCNICGRKYIRQDYLRKHQASAHNSSQQVGVGIVVQDTFVEQKLGKERILGNEEVTAMQKETEAADPKHYMMALEENEVVLYIMPPEALAAKDQTIAAK